MTRRAFSWIIIAGFAVVMGHTAWRVWGPSVPEYGVGGESMALTGGDPEQKSLYLRRNLYLSQHPRHAWLQVLAPDDLEVFVNGKLVEKQVLDSFPVAVVADITPYLKLGRNAIAIAVHQNSFGNPPQAAVIGGYTLDDGEHPIVADSSWRYSTVFERDAAWWFAPEFDDRSWPEALLRPCSLKSKVGHPPRAVSEGEIGQWITPPMPADSQAAVRREFRVEGRPKQAWLRVTASSSYRLAVNGVVLDEQEAQIGTSAMIPPVQRTYDLTPLVKEGDNVCSLILTSNSGPPRLRVDGEIETSAGVERLASGDRWLARSDFSSSWLDLKLSDAPAWAPCLVEKGDVGFPPWTYRREIIQVSLPFSIALEKALPEILLILLIGAATLLICWRLARSRPSFDLICLSLILPTLILASLILVGFDPRVSAQAVYRSAWLLIVLAVIPLQWLLMGLLKIGRFKKNKPRIEHGLNTESQPFSYPVSRVPAISKFGVVLPFIVLMAIGFWLRAKDVALEPLHWDEVENYEATLGFLQRGFPSREINPDMPIAYMHTSELFFVPTALSALIFNDDHYVVRFPGVCWSTFTILLIFLAGRALFGTWAGLIAAAIHTFSPLCIAMSDIGRYFAQLQFFTLLTIFLYWRAIRGTGPLDRRFVWLTGLSFLVTYLTWEGAALLAPGMILSVLIQRLGRWRTIFTNGSVWLAMLLVAGGVIAQLSHVTLQQTQFLWYGTSHSDAGLRPMWNYPFFQPWYYIWESSWNQDALIPMLGLVGAAFLAIRHPFRRPVRYLLLIHVTTCLLMASLLEASAFRYIHHMIPMTILLASATLVAMARAVFKMTRHVSLPAASRGYAYGLGAMMILTVLVLGSGMTIQLPTLSAFRIEAYGLRTYRIPDLQGPADFVRAHFQPGDVILATDPFQINHFLAQGPVSSGQWPEDRRRQPPASSLATRHYPLPTTLKVDYWPESILRHPATLDDVQAIPLDRRDGTPMLPDLDALKEVFARHDRIWFILQPERHWDQTLPEVSAFLHQHMDVAYEDAGALVLVRDKNHRPASMRRHNDNSLHQAQTETLR